MRDLQVTPKADWLSTITKANQTPGIRGIPESEIKERERHSGPGSSVPVIYARLFHHGC